MATPKVLAEPNSASGRQEFVKHYGSTVIGQALLLGMGVVTGILAARMLGPAGRGELAAVVIWPTSIVTLISLGINQAIAYNVGGRFFTVDEVGTGALAIGIAQGVLAVLIGLLVVPHALAKYSPEVQRLGIIFVFLTPVLILSGYSGNLFQGRQDLHSFNLIRVAPSVTYFFGLVALYLLHLTSVKRVVYAQLAGFGVALVFGLLLAFRYLRPRFHWNLTAVSRMLHYGWRTQVSNLANQFNQRVDQLILSLFVPPAQLGLYAVAVTLSNAVTVFPQAAGIVTFSRGSSQQHKDARLTIGTSFRASLAWLLVACALLYFLAPILIHTVFGAKFDGSIIACRILLPGTFLVGLNQVLYNGASALGRPGLPSIAEGVSMGITALGLYFLVPRYGYVGAAIVSTIAYTVSFTVMLFIMRKALGLHLRSLFFGGSEEPVVMGE